MGTTTESARPSHLTLDRRFDRLFEELARPMFSLLPRTEGFAPSLDVYEEKNNLVVKAELPGLSKEDIHIELDGNQLTIRGEKKWEDEKKERDYHCVERRYGSFYRQLTLPESADVSKAKAEQKDGVLTITFPKRAEAQKKKLNINVKK